MGVVGPDDDETVVLRFTLDFLVFMPGNFKAGIPAIVETIPAGGYLMDDIVDIAAMIDDFPADQQAAAFLRQLLYCLFLDDLELATR